MMTASGRSWRLLRVLGAIAALGLMAGCGPTAPPAGTGPAPDIATTPTIDVSGNTNGPFPQPQEETFQGCPPQGDSGDTALNLRKNRIDPATSPRLRTLQDLLALTWPPGVEKVRRDQWTSADTAEIAQNEGRPVQTDGYVLKVRHEGPESPNCHDPNERDYHVWLGASPADSRANSMIVELTPRVVALNPGWGSEQTLLRLAGHHVRVSGWLLMDQEHPEQLHQTRGTLWEIHPVTHIDVEQNGQWLDLASGQVTLRGTSGYRSGSNSSYPPPSRHRSRRRRRSHNS